MNIRKTTQYKNIIRWTTSYICIKFLMKGGWHYDKQLKYTIAAIRTQEIFQMLNRGQTGTK